MSEKNEFIRSNHIYYPSILSDIKKSSNPLQPVFEALTNSLESIKISDCQIDNSYVNISIYLRKNLDGKCEFEKFEIEDNGVGFNEQEFNRFNRFRDNTKGFSNFGSGRIQYVHFFNESLVKSSYIGLNGQVYERLFILSKKDNYLSNHAIVFHCHNKISDGELKTKIEFKEPLDDKDRQIYSNLTPKEIKDTIIKRYLLLLCNLKSIKKIPRISIISFEDNKETMRETISDSDIPEIDKSENFEISYSSFDETGKIAKTTELESFSLTCFKINSNAADVNDLKIVSKGEIVEKSQIVLEKIRKTDVIDSHRYQFLLSSEYFNKIDNHSRGDFSIPSKKNATKEIDLINTKLIFFEDIQDLVTSKIDAIYPEILEENQKQVTSVEELKKLFNISEDADVKISANDSEQKILEKFYESEARKAAEIDANIKREMEVISTLNPKEKSYRDDLYKAVRKISEIIPVQNKNALAQYVARRKIVLELFSKCLNSPETDEAFIHALIFPKKSSEPIDSDLWMINEEFIYFDGSSERPLNEVMYKGKKVLKSTFSEAENEHLHSFGENRKIKRPDVLLFPSECKCIIVEFKDKDTNVSNYLSQVEKYANLILKVHPQNLWVDFGSGRSPSWW